MNITEAMNTYDVALFTIKNKGFEISLELNESKDEILFWIARKNKIIVSAYTPLSLLALVVISEEHGANWNSVETGNLYDKILGSEI